jgi:serine/threonine protein kinase
MSNIDGGTMDTEQIAIWILEALKDEYEREPDLLKCRTEGVILGEMMVKRSLSQVDINRAIRFLLSNRAIEAVNRNDGRATRPTATGLKYLASRSDLPKNETDDENARTSPSEQAISILQQFLDCGGHVLIYRDWGEGRWTLQVDNLCQIEVTEPRFIQDDLNELVEQDLLRIEWAPDGNPLYHVTRNAARFIAQWTSDAEEHHKSSSLSPSTSIRELGQGQSFGQWTLQESIGRGGNGEVWSAKDANHRLVAIKFLHPDFFGKQREQRFRDEVNFLSQEAHRPGILPLIDHHLPEKSGVDDRPWFSTPFAECFGQLPLAGPESLEKLVGHVHIIAQALTQLHEEEKFHRDLKPENLFLLNGLPVIGDFGLVDYPGKDANTRESENLGSRNYTAPELEGNAGDINAGPADVFSLAKTLWVLASGRTFPPQGHLRADTPALRLSSFCNHSRCQILDNLLERATNHSTTIRPTMQQFATELAAWLNPPTALTGRVIDLAVVANEYQGTIAAAHSTEEKKQQLIQAVNQALASFDPLLKDMAAQIRKHFKVDTCVEDKPVYDRHQFLGYVGGPQLVWNIRQTIKIGLGFETITWLNTFVQAEGISDDTIRLVAGHFIERPAQYGIPSEEVNRVWAKEIRAPRGSAELENGLHAIRVGLQENVGLAMKNLYEQINNPQHKS